MQTLSKKVIEDTKKVWQPYYKDEILTDEDAIEIYNNVTGFFSLLIEQDRKNKQEKG